MNKDKHNCLVEAKTRISRSPSLIETPSNAVKSPSPNRKATMRNKSDGVEPVAVKDPSQLPTSSTTDWKDAVNVSDP